MIQVILGSDTCVHQTWQVDQIVLQGGLRVI